MSEAKEALGCLMWGLVLAIGYVAWTRGE